MQNTPIAQRQQQLQQFFNSETVQSQIAKVVQKNQGSFTTALMNIVNANNALANCEPNSIMNCALMAATLNLPIEQNLGCAYIIPYGNKAQFQMGYKGFIQLAIRSGEIKNLKPFPVYQNQVVSLNPVTGYEFDFNQKPNANEKPVGYYAFFRLMNGAFFDDYMSREEVEKHAKKFSKSYGNKNGVWTEHFDAMAQKTVLKRLLSKYAPLSVEMQQAIQADQAIINSIDGDYRYVDNESDTEKQAVELTQGVDSPEREEIIVNAEEIAKTGNSDNLKEYLTADRRKILGTNEYRRLLVFASAIAKLRPLPTEEIGSNAVEMSDKCKTDIEKMAVADAVDCVLKERNQQSTTDETATQQQNDDDCPF